MNNTLVSKMPLLFLVGISICWGFYYQSNSSINGYGNANFEWLFLLDTFISLPVICFLCVKDKKEALTKAIFLCCGAVFIGSYIIPEESKLIWHHLEDGRYLVLAIIVGVEAVAISSVYFAVKCALGDSEDPDVAIQRPIEKYVGVNPIASVLNFETRMWMFAVFSKHITPHQFSGDQHFTYHRKDGAKTNLLGFILLIVFEAPIMHLLLHYVWSPFGANVVTLLTLFSLLFFIAEYRAVSRRPISMTKTQLIVRYGLYHPLNIPFENIEKVEINQKFVPRALSIKRFNYSGVPNIKLALREPLGPLKEIYIGVDNAQRFISALQDAGISDASAGSQA